MKQVQENLNAFKDTKFFNSLFEEGDLSPVERKKLKDELEKQGYAVVKKCINNFASFKKNAGDIWQEYRDFWSTQEDAEASVDQKGMFYNLWESDYIVGVVKEPQGHAALKVINTSAGDDEYIAFSSTSPDVVKAFQEFYNNDLKATIKQVVNNQKEAMAAKKAADAQAEKDESKAAKKAQLDAFLGESMNESSYSDFFMNYSQEIQSALNILKQIGNKASQDEITEDMITPQLEKLDNIYDEEVVEWIASVIYSGGRIDPDNMARMAIDNMNRQGTEMQMVLQAIEDLGSSLGVYNDSDE